MRKINDVPNIDRRNTIIIYVREEDKPIVKRFLRYITKDERLLVLKKGERMGLMSIAFVRLAQRYVNDAEDLKIPGITDAFVTQVTNQIDAGRVLDANVSNEQGDKDAE
jgi:hypothetical protein